MASKRRRKEKARKAEQDHGRQPQRREEDPSVGEEDGRAAKETELPVTPSAEVLEAMTSSPIDLEEIGEPSERQGEFEE